jgi:uncharacterized protein YjbI with pentapeptide repeats
MPNQEHLDILAKGVDAWNAWRNENSNIRPVLDTAILEGRKLDWANLADADLSGAKLNRASLRGANLGGANFGGADLTDADLSGASACRAYLSSAKLIGAKFKDADLTLANLNYAEVSNTDFTNVGVGSTVFANIDLTDAIGLETIRHRWNSVIGTEMPHKLGKLPEVFLRGVGLSDQVIAVVRKSVGQPYYHSCFISHSSADRPFTDRLYADLQARGVRCWYAPEDMKTGDRTRLSIDESIRLHKRLLLVLSAASVRSAWVEQEVETAIARESSGKPPVLFPIRLDDTVMEIESGWPSLIKRTRQIGDFTGWQQHESYTKAFDRLLRDLEATPTDKPMTEGAP